MNDQPANRLLAVANAILIAALFLLAWQALDYELVPGVVVHDIGPCAMDWHRARPALVLACPGRDMVRVWPLPVVQPWSEDDASARPAPPLQGFAARFWRAGRSLGGLSR